MLINQKVDPEQAEALDNFLEKLKSYAAGEHSFTFMITDPAGNSFIENPSVLLFSWHLIAIHVYKLYKRLNRILYLS